jgi:hypothetical protein
MARVKVVYTAKFETEIEVPDESTDQEIVNAVGEIEPGDGDYVDCSYKVESAMLGGFQIL